MGFNSVVMSNLDVLLVFGIYNDSVGNSCTKSNLSMGAD